MKYSESPVVFQCYSQRLIGIITKSLDPPLATGVLILVGGPQYRAGSHRQFTLLARKLAKHRIASLRFDVRGMGDSEGDPRLFDDLSNDIEAAIDILCSNEPLLRSIVIWGLCDAASAALIYGYQDPRVSGLILLNPWVHTETSVARVRLKHYYLRRLTDLSLWRKLFSGHLRVGQSLSDLTKAIRVTLGQVFFLDNRLGRDDLAIRSKSDSHIDQTESKKPDFIERMHEGLCRFKGDILCILSDNDLITKEFDWLINGDQRWRHAWRSKRFSRCEIPGANHTFSSYEWRETVSNFTVDFVEHGISVDKSLVATVPERSSFTASLHRAFTNRTQD